MSFRFQNQKHDVQRDQDNEMFEKIDGTTLKLTDVSARFTHDDRQIIVREGITGKLRDGNEVERRRSLDLYWPSKYQITKPPQYIDVDDIRSLEAMDNLFQVRSNFVVIFNPISFFDHWKRHGFAGPLQVMDAAVNYYELDDERYLRLRVRINERLIKDKRLDDLYASRHFGQLALYVSGNEDSVADHFQIIEKYPFPELLANHIIDNRKGNLRAYELRALFMILVWSLLSN